MENRSSGEDISKHVKINDDGTKELCLDERQLSDWPEGITDQTYLEGLHLRDNYLTKLPEDINKLKNLKILKVDRNNLKHLPDSVCGLTELKELSVNNNQLSCLPTDILKLTKLEKMNLSVNNLTNFPDNTGHLKELCVSHNLLRTVPTCCTQNFTKLERLFISGNNLQDLPDNIGNLKHLRELSVSHNQLSRVPTSIQQLTELEKLDLGKNKLEALPDSIGGLKELRELSVYTNLLSTVPKSIGLLTKLQRLNMNENRLTSLPDSIGDLEELRELSLSSNQLSILPDSVQNLTKLQRLHLDENKLNDLPDSIGDLKELKELCLNINQLSTVPYSIQKLRKLEVLFLAYNKLTEIPVDLSDQKGLTKLNVRGNPLTFDAVKKLLVLKLGRSGIGIDIDVPAEIESQGEKAQRAYIKALNDGFVKVYRGRILVVGQARAGKTCLKNNLLGLPFDPNEKSTDGIEVDPSKFEIDVDQVKNWQSTNKDEQLLGCSEGIAKILIEKLPHEKDFKAIGCLLDEDLKKERDEEKLKSDNDEETKGDKRDSHMNQDAEPNVAVGTSDYPSAQPELNVDATSLPDEIKSHTNQLIKGLRCESVEKEQSVISMHLWDFAGQHFYYATHPIFFSSRAIYLLVHNLSKSLNETATPYYRQGYNDVKLENPTGETNLENFQSWLATVHNITQMRGVDESDTVQRKPNYLQPPVLIVGTHADRPAENISNTNSQIRERIAPKEYVKHVVQPFFNIDNTGRLSENDCDQPTNAPQAECKIDSIQALRNRIMQVWNQEPYMGEKIPVRWISFERVINALVAENSYHQSLRQLRCYARDKCFIKDNVEFDTMIKFYHDLGIIVKHRETVILDAQWLIKLFKQLITIPHFKNADPIVSTEWRNLENTGILSKELIDHVFKKFEEEDGVVKADILHLMEQFGLIAEFSEKYFVPAQLKAPPDNLCAVQPTESDPCPLFLLFVGDFVPHGLFTQLVVRSIGWCSRVGPTEVLTLYRNEAWFLIGSSDFSYSFYLICKKRFIKLVLKERTKRDQNRSSRVATKVRQFVAETLQGLSQDLAYLKGLQYHFGVECPHCQQRKGKCKEHLQEQCEDCLHLLQIKQGVALWCEKKRDEELKVPGLEKWFFENKMQELHEDVISQVDSGTSSEDQSSAVKRKPPFSVSCTSPPAKQRKVAPADLKEGNPSEYELALLSGKLGDSWKSLARRLLFSDAEITGFCKNYGKLAEMAAGMLIKWRQREGANATYKVLYFALCDDLVERKDLADDFCCN